jgi:hypothetical protein
MNKTLKEQWIELAKIRAWITDRDSKKTPPDSADKTGFFNRFQQELKPKPHPTEEQEVVVNMTPIKKTDSDAKT